MENPVITLTPEAFVVISQHTHRLALYVQREIFPLNSLMCHFLENERELYAAVSDSHDNLPNLAHRVVSFLSAYVRIHDSRSMERDILDCIERCLRR